jgi:hypothetical protein
LALSIILIVFTALFPENRLGLAQSTELSCAGFLLDMEAVQLPKHFK